MGISQPGMSHALKELRKILGDPLLISGKNGYVPTQKALSIHQSLKPAFSLIELALQEKSFVPETANISLKVMMTDYAGSIFLPQLMKKLEPYPGIHIEVLPWDFGIGHTFLGYDFAIGFSQPNLPKFVKEEVLFNETYVCMFRKGHPRIKNSLDLDTFLNESHIIVREADGAVGVVNDALAKLGLRHRRKIGLEVPQFLLFPYIVSETDMIITTTTRNIALFMDKLPIRSLPVPLDIPSVKVTLLWHQRFQKSVAHQWFRQLILSVV
jgi:DNA-binding transcriptional LysR family regulator